MTRKHTSLVKCKLRMRIIEPRMRCCNGGCWNKVSVSKIFVEQNVSDPKVKAYIPMYEPLQIVKCKKCGKIIAKPKELIRILKRT